MKVEVFAHCVLFLLCSLASYDLSGAAVLASYGSTGCSSDSCCEDGTDEYDKCDGKSTCSCQQMFVTWDCRSDLGAFDSCN